MTDLAVFNARVEFVGRPVRVHVTDDSWFDGECHTIDDGGLWLRDAKSLTYVLWPQIVAIETPPPEEVTE